MPFMKYALFLPLFVYGKTEFHAETAEDCQRVCELSRSCNFWNFSKTERQTEGFDLTCQLLNSGKRVSGVSFKKSDENVEEFSCGSFLADSSEDSCRYEINEENHAMKNDPTYGHIYTITEGECEEIFEKCVSCQHFRWTEVYTELDSNIDQEMNLFAGYCQLQNKVSITAS
ncbi:unnamed protein product [Oikopleura dioica]|uniref:Apple domain-containing protein n=2 Tax=Oikopleura dioica TaxID=34765 RepID=E4XA32_OIKDI|nr:unnamed protein product [Oikopleura dioica]